MKKVFCVFILIMTLFISACSPVKKQESKEDRLYPDYSPISAMIGKSEDFNKKIPFYDSAYTVCFQNNEIYSVFVFASPIQYRTETGDFAFIDNDIVKSSDESYTYENKANSAKTYFPQNIHNGIKICEKDQSFQIFPLNNSYKFSDVKKISFTNMYGQTLPAVIYENEYADIAFYPTRLGCRCETIIKKDSPDDILNWSIKQNEGLWNIDDKNYALLKDDSETNRIVINTPIVYSNGIFQTENTAVFNKGQENISVNYNNKIISESNSYPIKTDISFDIYKESMPDSSVYSQNAANQYKRNFSMVGTNEDYGKGIHYLRMRLIYYFNMEDKDIKDVTYNIKAFEKNNDTVIKLTQVDSQWSSKNINWLKKSRLTNIISAKKPQDGNYSFDITDFAMKNFKDRSDGIIESVGAALDADKGYSFVFTSDDALYAPYIRINVNEYPGDFYFKETINDVD